MRYKLLLLITISFSAQSMSILRNYAQLLLNRSSLITVFIPSLFEWKKYWNNEQNICNATCRVRSFIKERAHKKGMMTSCAQYANGYSSHSIERALNIDQELTEHNIHQILLEPKKYIDEWHEHAAIIDHELTHITQSHMQKSLLYSLLIPLASCGCLALIAKNRLKIPLTICMGIYNFFIMRQIAQSQEFEADAGVEDNIEILEGLKRVLERNEQFVDRAKPYLFAQWQQRGIPSWSHELLLKLCATYSTHPDRLERINRIQKRINQLRT